VFVQAVSFSAGVCFVLKTESRPQALKRDAIGGFSGTIEVVTFPTKPAAGRPGTTGHKLQDGQRVRILVNTPKSEA
jgi:hypothetical protein